MFVFFLQDDYYSHISQREDGDQQGHIFSNVCSLAHKFWKIILKIILLFLKLGNTDYCVLLMILTILYQLKDLTSRKILTSYSGRQHDAIIWEN